MRSPALVLSAVVLCLCAHAQSPQPFSLKLKPGPFAVGLRHRRPVRPLQKLSDQRIDDLGKPATGERSRPLQTLVWYPADATAARNTSPSPTTSPLRSTETSFAAPQGLCRIGRVVHRKASPIPRTRRPLAVRDAAPLSRRFPLVIYAPKLLFLLMGEPGSLRTPREASATSSSPAQAWASIAESTHDTAGASAQAQDISFLIGWGGKPSPTPTRPPSAVIGFSWGGLSNVFAAARDSRITALVALSTAACGTFPDSSSRQATSILKQMTIPLLFFKGRGSLEGQGAARSQLQTSRRSKPPQQPGPMATSSAWRCSASSTPSSTPCHSEANAIGTRTSRIARRPTSRATTARSATPWVTEYTREFLDAYLQT